MRADTINYRFTGKERDQESGLDYFGARYYGSALGRFTSPDWATTPQPVPYASLTDPQTLNLYSYVRNNPLRSVDADGHYEVNPSNCLVNTAKCQKKYDKAADKFERRRQKDLNSKKGSVRAAAAAYGARGETNGVHVGFANLASQGINGSVGPTGNSPLTAGVQVTIDFGRAGSAETQTHEGTHVIDDMKFLNSWTPTAGYDQGLNITHGQTEFNAFKAGAEVNHEHGFGPNDDQKIWDFLRNSPTYGPILNLPVFDPNKFPAGPSNDIP